MLFKEIVDGSTDGRTHARTHGRRTPDIEGSQKLTKHFVLRWAKKYQIAFRPNLCYLVSQNFNMSFTSDPGKLESLWIMFLPWLIRNVKYEGSILNRSQDF